MFLIVFTCYFKSTGEMLDVANLSMSFQMFDKDVLNTQRGARKKTFSPTTDCDNDFQQRLRNECNHRFGVTFPRKLLNGLVHVGMSTACKS